MTLAGSNIIFFFILCYLKPYKENRTNNIRILSELFYTLGLISMIKIAY